MVLASLHTGPRLFFRKEARTMNRSGKRNLPKAQEYREVMDFCHNPKCKCGYGLNCHHIQPLGRGGADSYWNYVVLCAQCHRTLGYHSRWECHQTELTVFKLYSEKLRLGRSSADCSEGEFGELLRAAGDGPGCGLPRMLPERTSLSREIAELRRGYSRKKRLHLELLSRVFERTVLTAGEYRLTTSPRLAGGPLAGPCGRR